jgi:hypothetical protein
MTSATIRIRKEYYRAALGILTLLLAACEAAPSRPPPPPSPEASSSSSLSQLLSTPKQSLRSWSEPECRPPSLSRPVGPEAQEIQGSMTSGMGSLLVRTSMPILVPGAKMVLRMTGSGPLFIYLDGPQGRQVVPYLTYHLRSDWIAPGDEWGGNVPLETSGCWAAHVYRSTAAVFSFNVQQKHT